MSRVHRRGVIAGPRAAGAKTYAEFVAHITGLATGGSLAFNGDAPSGGSSLAYTVDADSTSSGGVMTGSPWLSTYRRAGTRTVRRIVQHSLPSEAEFDNQRTNSLKLLIRLEDTAGATSLPALARNGYTSTSYSGGSTPTAGVSEVLYWSTQPMKMQPSLGLGPAPYDW